MTIIGSFKDAKRGKYVGRSRVRSRKGQDEESVMEMPHYMKASTKDKEQRKYSCRIELMKRMNAEKNWKKFDVKYWNSEKNYIKLCINFEIKYFQVLIPFTFYTLVGGKNHFATSRPWGSSPMWFVSNKIQPHPPEGAQLE